MESVLAACNSGWTVSVRRRVEESFLLGHNKSMVVLAQLYLISTAFYLLEKAAGADRVPLAARRAVYALSGGTALAMHYTEPVKDQQDAHVQLRKGLFAVHRNLGALCEATAFGAALVWTAQGSYVEGGITAVTIAAGFLHRKSLMPKTLKPAYVRAYTVQKWLGLAWVFGYGNKWNKAAYGMILAANYAQPKRARDDLILPLTSAPGNWRAHFASDDDQQINSWRDQYTLKLNWQHIDEAVTQTIPEAQPRNIGELNNFVAWFEKYPDTVQTVLDADDNWVKSVDIGADSAPHLRAGIETLVKKVTGRDATFIGKPSELSLLSNLLRLLIEKYEDDSIPEDERALSLCRLAAHGHYCGDGYLAMAQKEYFYLTNQTENLSFEGAVTRLLAERRLQIFDGVMYQINSHLYQGTLDGVIGADTAEHQQQYVRAFGPLIGHPGLQAGRAASSSSHFLPSAVERFLRIFNGKTFLVLFYQQYTPTEVKSSIRQGLKENRITQEQLNDALQKFCAPNKNTDVSDAFDSSMQLEDSWLDALLTQCGVFIAVKKGGRR